MMRELKDDFPSEETSEIALDVLRLAVPLLVELKKPIQDDCKDKERELGSSQIFCNDFT